MVICADTSFLFSLYGNDVNSARAVRWMGRCSQALSLSPFNAFELGNALRCVEFRKILQPGEAAGFWALFEAAISQGRLIREVCNLSDVVSEAVRLSGMYSLGGGHRAFDILHVAAALHMGATEFLTFDANQKSLAQREGLQVPF
jgi:predicted nucleic acid-binding protein